MKDFGTVGGEDSLLASRADTGELDPAGVDRPGGREPGSAAAGKVIGRHGESFAANKKPPRPDQEDFARAKVKRSEAGRLGAKCTREPVSVNSSPYGLSARDRFRLHRLRATGHGFAGNPGKTGPGLLGLEDRAESRRQAGKP